MQVSVEDTGGLQRRLTVQIPATRVDQEVDNRLKSLSRTVRVAGFRPGKVPHKVLQAKYGSRVRQEVVGELIQSSYHDAITQQNLQPAGEPNIVPKPSATGQDLEFTATFEVFPELTLAPMDGISIDKPLAEVVDADIDEMLEVLRKQRLTWEGVSRAASLGDQVTIDCSGTMNGTAFPGGEMRNTPIELGSGTFIEGFEAGLVGKQAGDEVALDLTFPADYHSAALAGKPVRFAVKVIAVAQPNMPDINDEFAASFGIKEGGVEALRREVGANMRRELEATIKVKVKEQLLDALMSANPVTPPSSLVDQEVERLMRQDREDHGSQASLQPRDVYVERARRRVVLGLLIAGIVKANAITVDPAKVRSTIESIAASYEEPEEVVKWYYGNRQLLSGIEALVLEDQVVEWMLQRVAVHEQPTTFKALMQPGMK